MKPRSTTYMVFLSLALAVSYATASADEVFSKNRKGNDYYKKEKFDDALKEYEDALLVAPADTLLKMNRGSTLYRLGRLTEADSAYSGTLLMSNRRKRADAHYNLGNIQFKEGDMLMQSGGQGADEKYKAALQNYIAALDLKPDDKDAKWNIELTQRRIKQQEQQQKNQDKQDKNKDNKDNKQDQNKQNQNDRDKQDRQKQDKNKEQDKKDENKNQQQQDQNTQNDRQQQEPPKPQPQENNNDMKKKEAERIIMQFADDADSLNKPPKKQGSSVRQRKLEKDW